MLFVNASPLADRVVTGKHELEHLGVPALTGGARAEHLHLSALLTA